MFCKRMNEEFNTTKGYLSLLDINLILENPYILNFFKKNNNLWKYFIYLIILKLIFYKSEN